MYAATICSCVWLQADRLHCNGLQVPDSKVCLDAWSLSQQSDYGMGCAVYCLVLSGHLVGQDSRHFGQMACRRLGALLTSISAAA